MKVSNLCRALMLSKAAFNNARNFSYEGNSCYLKSVTSIRVSGECVVVVLLYSRFEQSHPIEQGFPLDLQLHRRVLHPVLHWQPFVRPFTRCLTVVIFS